MIKLICFDYDGILLDLCECHKQNLNDAIEQIAGIEYVISDKEHCDIYNGLSTKTKLELLIKLKSLPEHYVEDIKKLKQSLTLQELSNKIKFPINTILINDLKKLKSEGIKLAVCSNAKYETVEKGLRTIGVFNLFDSVLGNDNIVNKPSPEIYQITMKLFNVNCNDTLILEDSDVGLKAAYASGAYVMKIENVFDVTYSNIKNMLNNIGRL